MYSCMLWCMHDLQKKTLLFTEKEGKELEAEMNTSGPGTAFFVQCDVSKESDIKVRLWLD